MSAPDDRLLDERVREALEELAAKHPLPWVDAGEETKSSSNEEAA